MDEGIRLCVAFHILLLSFCVSVLFTFGVRLTARLGKPCHRGLHVLQ